MHKRHVLSDLRGQDDTHDRYSAIFYKGDNFCVFLYALLHPKPFWKGSTVKGKNLLPMGANSFLLEYTHWSKFFPFTVDPFLKGRQNNNDRVASPEIISPWKYIHSP